MKLSEWLSAQERVKSIKTELVKLGWTVRFGAESPMNHGPMHTREQAETLFQEWVKLDNPYGIPVGSTDEYHSFWAL